MSILVRAVLLAGTAALVGCSASPPPQAPTVVKGPHGGTTIRLPEDAGFVEFVNEPEPDGRERDATTALVVYFLKTDGSTPINPAPADVKFEAKGGRKPAQTLALAPEPKTDDPSGAARFASKRGPYSLGEIRGRVSASVGGKPVSAEYLGAR